MRVLDKQRGWIPGSHFQDSSNANLLGEWGKVGLNAASLQRILRPLASAFPRTPSLCRKLRDVQGPWRQQNRRNSRTRNIRVVGERQD